MSNMNFDSIDKRLIDLVQTEFPLKPSPYSELGLKLDIDEDEVIQRIEQLKAKGIIRQISPVLDARRLGYRSTLVAMRVNKTELGKTEQLIRQHPGVSHGYERDHCFNVWFTLSLPPPADIETELKRLTDSIGAEAVFSLPAIKVFKIGAYFAMGGDDKSADTRTQSDGVLPRKAELSRADRLIINELQQDLPLVPMPFTTMAERLGMDEEYFLAQCQSLKQRGIMRRFGASVNHRKAGFKANAMTCWVAPPDMVDAAGQRLASLREVSHCYERETNPLWQYNLFAMIHGHAREACQSIVSDVSQKIGLMDYVLLFSTKEFKKTRVKYLV